MAKSIVDRIREMWSADKQMSAEKKEQVYQQILSGMAKTEEQKQLYKIYADRAIVNAKRAAENGDLAGKKIAMRELKASYSFYHYMNSMYDAFRAMESQVRMQNVTQEFAEVVNGLSSIRVNATSMDFAALTQKALKSFKPVDLAGLDQMVDSLVRGSITATESEQADDAFLEALVEGRATLDTPYPSKTLEEYDSAKKGKAGEHDDQKDDIMALLDQMVSKLNEE